MAKELFYLVSWDEDLFWADVRDYPTEQTFRDAFPQPGEVSQIVLVGCRRNSEIDGDCQSEVGAGFHWHPEPWPSRLARRKCWQLDVAGSREKRKP